MTLHFYLQLEVVNENTGQPKSARAFLLSMPMENETFSFPIGVDNKKALALFSCPISSGQNFF